MTICYKDVKSYIDSIADELSGRKIILYPYGNGGRLAQFVLNERGLAAEVIIDNSLCGKVPDIFSHEILESLELNEYALIMVTDFHKELFYPLYELAQKHEGFRLFNFHHKTLGGIVVSLTDRCNLRCKICTNHLIKEHSDLTFDQIKTVIDDARELNLNVLSFVGLGEPLLHPDFADSIRYAVESGIPGVGVYTNGLLLNEQMTDVILSSGITYLNISITGYSPEVYAKMQGYNMDSSKVRDIVYGNVLYLLDEKARRGSKLWVTLRTILFKGEEADFCEFINYWRDKVDDILLSYPHSIYKRSLVHNGKCRLLGNSIGIEANGNILLCERGCLSTEKLGKVGTDRIKDLADSPCYHEWRYYSATGHIEGLPSVCRRCAYTVDNPANEYVASYLNARRLDKMTKILDYSKELYLYGNSLALVDFIMYSRTQGTELKLRLFYRENIGSIDVFDIEIPDGQVLSGKTVIVFSDRYTEDARYLRELSAIPINYTDLV